MKFEEMSIETMQELNKDGIFIEVNDGIVTGIIGTSDDEVYWRVERDN